MALSLAGKGLTGRQLCWVRDGSRDYGQPPRAMIDALSLLISHGVIMLAAWRLLSRPDLDRDPDEVRDDA